MPGIIRSRLGDDGYWTDPRSECCGALVLFYAYCLEEYHIWQDIEHLAVPDELRCQKCDQLLTIERTT
jgi:hypothetical protein